MKRLKMSLKAALLATCTAVVLTGCDTIGSVIDTRGVDATQDAMQAAEDTLCRYVPVGGVIRRYNTADRASAYVQFCFGNPANGAPLIEALDDTGALDD